MTARTETYGSNEVAVDTSGDRKKGRLSAMASAGSIVSAFIASACCVGPLVFALLGLGGAGLLLKFEPYRTYFIVLTALLLGTGFYFTYRKPKAVATTADDIGCACPAPRTNRAGRVLLWIATVLVVLFLSFPYIAAAIWG